jgi:NADPH-dependent 2,4-dienoyl-CoA reductase/sulfur reductase-like enzyme
MSLPEKSLRAAYAQHLLHEHLSKRQESLPNAPNESSGEQDTGGSPTGTRVGAGHGYPGRICIVGAGACGLYLAMMLKYLGFTNVDILEGSDRVGGRCYTYPKAFSDDGTNNHDYYDVGAMRIPDIPWMQG